MKISWRDWKRPRQVSRIYMKLIRLVENRNRNPNRIAERELSGASNFSGALEQGCDVDDAPHKRRVCFRLREIYLNIYTSIPYYITYLYACLFLYIPPLWAYWISLSCCQGAADSFVSILIIKRSAVSVAHYAFGISFKHSYYHLILEAKTRQIFSLNIYNVLMHYNYYKLSWELSFQNFMHGFCFDGQQIKKTLFETFSKHS